MRARISSILFVAVFVASSIDFIAAESKTTPRLRHQNDKTARYLTTTPTTGTASNEERAFEWMRKMLPGNGMSKAEPNIGNYASLARTTSGVAHTVTKESTSFKAIHKTAVAIIIAVVFAILLRLALRLQ
ncbi:unnamed protein product [Peronospora farinosa]|uniref:RxLR effector protein n=1 Tax=Peronospora farinosa TaxID=134698 RepID=A0ABN8C6Y3_9STRA|nr:unnamed protein product [Peronospora farinosa]